MRVIIMGCGRVGARLANLLETEGHAVTVVDTDSSSFDRLGPDFAGTTMVGSGIDMDALERAGIEGADAFAAVTQGDNRNIMASQIAKEIYKVPKVVTRIYDPIRQDTFQTLGIEAISPTVIGASAFYNRLTGKNADDGV